MYRVIKFYGKKCGYCLMDEEYQELCENNEPLEFNTKEEAEEYLTNISTERKLA